MTTYRFYRVQRQPEQLIITVAMRATNRKHHEYA